MGGYPTGADQAAGVLAGRVSQAEQDAAIRAVRRRVADGRLDDGDAHEALQMLGLIPTESGARYGATGKRLGPRRPRSAGDHATRFQPATPEERS